MILNLTIKWITLKKMQKLNTFISYLLNQIIHALKN